MKNEIENEKVEQVNIPTVAAENVGASIKQLVLQEMKVMPNVWQKLSEREQIEVVGRIDKGVRYTVAAAVNTIASANMVRLSGYIEQINLKDKIKVTLIVDKNRNNSDDLSELYDAANGVDCQIVIADSDQYIGGMDLIDLSESDQGELVDNEDNLLWCVVVPIRQGKSVVPAPSHQQAETFARRCREVLIEHDSDLAACVYAMPYQQNKAGHARMLKQGHWKQLQEWYAKLEAGDIKAEVVGLIEYAVEVEAV